MNSKDPRNKKSITNLYEEPQMRAGLLEPSAPNTYDFGTRENQWNEIVANRVYHGNYAFETVIPTGLLNPSNAAPPATRAGNSGYEYYFRKNGSSLRVYKYYDNINGASELKLEPYIKGGYLFVAFETGNTTWMYYNRPAGTPPNGTWIRIAMQI